MTPLKNRTIDVLLMAATLLTPSYALAQSEFARIQSLLDERVVSQSEYDQRRTQMEAARQRFARLAAAIKTFEALRYSGARFPGTSESEPGLLGQKADLGQSPSRRLCTESP